MTQINEILAKYWGHPGITWNEFKTVLANERGWEYDPAALAFYTMRRGKKVWFSRDKVGMVAAFYGYYGSF